MEIKDLIETEQESSPSKVEQFVPKAENVEEPISITEPVKQPTGQVLEKITDDFLVQQLLNEYTPDVTKQVPIITQGISVETKTLVLSDLYSIAQSDNGRIKALSMCYDHLTPASKTIFSNDINIFFKTLSIYDIDLFYAAHAEAFGEEEFIFNCENEKCEKEVEFKAKLRDLRTTSDMLTARLDDIKNGKEVEFLELNTDRVIKINDDISFRVGICSLEKYKSLVEKKNKLPENIYKTLLQLDAIVFTKKNSELVYEPKFLPTFMHILDRLVLPESYKEQESKIFKELDIVFEAKIKCPHCGHVSHKYKTDLLGDLVKKVIA